MSAYDDLLAPARRDFRAALPGRVDAIRVAVAEACARPSDRAAAHAAQVLAHQLAGTAGVYGFEAIGALALVIDELFDEPTDPAKVAPALDALVAAVEAGP